jgi:predicted ABC-type transport system involved in lysophospholipase L1 biosynthesis ATPase subunit
MTVAEESRATAARALAECLGVSVDHGHGAGRVRALRDVTFAIGTGERVALVGRSGSGKTTLLHVLGGLIEPSAGTVTWKREPLSTLDDAARAGLRARGIAYVFQGAHLLPYFTAFENVAFAAAAVRGEPEAEHARENLELVGLAAKLDSLPSELSGGEAQRVAIARALAQRPELLLCDEPTGQLDSDTGRRVLDLIDALQARLGFALVVATHDSEVAARYKRVLTLSDGELS